MNPLWSFFGRLAVAGVAGAAALFGGGAVLAQSAAPSALPPGAAPGDSGIFVIRRGGDTVATERFLRTATALKGTLAIRNTRGTQQAYQAVVAPDASVALIEVTVREASDSARPGGPPAGRVVQRARVIFKEDSAAVDDITNRGMQTRIFATERGAVPYLNLSFALLEQAVRRAQATAPEASQVPFFNLGGGQTVDARITRLGADSVTMAIGGVEFHLRVDRTGRVLGGTVPAQQLVAERVGGT